jgi:hypothetical protein
MIFKNNVNCFYMNLFKKNKCTKYSLLLFLFFIINIILQQDIFSQIQIRNADYYFDGVNGNDSNNGFTPQTAKKTLAALNNLGAAMQDKVIAIRDSIVYRRSTNGYSAIKIDFDNVTLTNWYEGGSDKLPRILGSDSQITGWADLGGNIWQTIGIVGNSTLYFEFADSARWGILRTFPSELSKEFDFCFSGDTIYCYSPSDPGTRYVSIETCDRTFCINLYGDRIKVEYLQLDYAGSGVAIESVSDSNIIQYCRINFQGTSMGVLESCCGEGVELWSNGNIIRGNYICEASSHGIHLYTISGSMDNNLVEHNIVWNCHHTGYDVNTATGSITNTTIRYNIYYDTPWAAERQEPGYAGQSSGFFCNGNVSNITLAYNLFYNCYQSTGAQIIQGSNIFVYNNTFANTINYGSAGYGAIWGNSGTTAINNIFVTNGRTTTNGTFQFQSNNLVYNYGSGGVGVINDLNTNPQFVDRFNFNFRLLPESPAINLGVNLGYLFDFDGNPILGNPDAGAYEASSFGNSAYITVNAGWNFLSVPKLSTDMSVEYLFPTRISNVFSFNQTIYNIIDVVENGVGYAVKFNSLQYILITGQSVSFPIQVSSGWNIIGPFDIDIPINQISTNPPGIIISNFFGYNGIQYETSTILKVGKGYWIKVNEDGQINLNTEEELVSGKTIKIIDEIKENWGKIKFTDSQDKSITLYAADKDIASYHYEFPPMSLDGMFDVRYSNGKFAESLEEEKVILINSDYYPVTIKTEGVHLKIRDGRDNRLLDEIIEDGKEFEITDSRIKSIRVMKILVNEIPFTYKLYQNYPNPFNPRTTIKFSILKNEHVSLKIYNSLGEEIAELVNKFLPAGSYSHEWNTEDLSSGIYFYKIESGNFTDTKKMILLK